MEVLRKSTQRQVLAEGRNHLEDSPLPLQKWLPALWLLTNCKNGISSYELGRALGVTQKTAWFMLSRLRLALQAETGGKMSGDVELDETFIGAKPATCITGNGSAWYHSGPLDGRQGGRIRAAGYGTARTARRFAGDHQEQQAASLDAACHRARRGRNHHPHRLAAVVHQPRHGLHHNVIDHAEATSMETSTPTDWKTSGVS